ncbi:BnaC09g29710D [Brassica napus]|uniref:BnaC09g29710D protein n=1 Tax=Brassica napus TaxID=3708 RepID=A0A078HDY4_BRANA|nr:BnaC09g29710D [Brassica napus]
MSFDQGTSERALSSYNRWQAQLLSSSDECFVCDFLSRQL